MPPSRLQRIIAVTVAVVVLGVGGLLLARSGGGSVAPGPSAASPFSADPAAWQLPRLNAAGVVRLTDFRGRPLVVNFFASWCDPCRAELPVFARISTELQGRVQFAGVNSQETGDGAAMARQYGIGAWPLASDAGGANASGLLEALGGRGMPMTAFYDAEGRLLGTHPGALTELDLRAALRRYFAI